MPSAVPVTGSGPINDDLDDLFDYSVNIDEVFRDFENSNKADSEDRSAQQKTKGDSLGLGIDEEIKVAPKRQPVAKLDKKRSDRLKFKGKGHELGHKREIQLMRREWINEGKPREERLDVEFFGEAQNLQRAGEMPREKGNGAIQPPTDLGKDVHFDAGSSNDGDLYSASPRHKRDRATQQQPSDPAETLFLPMANDDKYLPEDDLDALLAENENETEKQTLTSNAHFEDKRNESSSRENFEDEMEAMAEMDDW
ncbi:MAG: hypothetical protein L6R37_004616 [Teloschistes peruensis]|nr:MAG: hypothetical protein L6R37_004616 [Teloschistes peruensis]